ncbi:MAG: GtrA family protein [Clostridia bacterium]|nr:GtrA family protein [Clostridia bacterium]
MKITELVKKNKEAILYIFFGGLTTLVNIVAYSVLYYEAQISNSLSNIIAWVISVVFAYITNKLFVFENRSFRLPMLLVEIGSFFACRILTGLLDLGVMYLCVDILNFHALVMKVLSNIIVIILNYIASKFFIFKKKSEAEND